MLGKKKGLIETAYALFAWMQGNWHNESLIGEYDAVVIDIRRQKIAACEAYIADALIFEIMDQLFDHRMAVGER